MVQKKIEKKSATSSGGGWALRVCDGVCLGAALHPSSVSSITAASSCGVCCPARRIDGRPRPSPAFAVIRDALRRSEPESECRFAPREGQRLCLPLGSPRCLRLPPPCRASAVGSSRRETPACPCQKTNLVRFNGVTWTNKLLQQGYPEVAGDVLAR